MRSLVVMVTGVAAVGKTTLCAKLAEDNQGFLHIRASSLLNDPPTVNIANLTSLEKNQAEIVSNWARKIAKFNSRVIMFDCHLTIPFDGGIYEVPVETLEKIEASAVILLESSADTIQQRRIARGRQADAKDLSLIRRQINVEHQRAQYVAGELSVPLLISSSAKYSSIRHFMSNLLLSAQKTTH